MTSDGTNTYVWDMENRLIQINYPGSGNYSQFAYDGYGQNVVIQEYSGATLTSTKQFVWGCDSNRPFQPSEARNSSGTVTAQYFLLGETISGTSYLYTKDRIGSIREMTTVSGNIESQYSYDPFGRTIQPQSTVVSDFQFARYYMHAPSGLNMTLGRLYSARLGRFLNRDPRPNDRFNLYAYVGNYPIGATDTSGFSPDYAQREFAAPGGYNYDPGAINCIGYAAGIGFAVYPGAGQSFGSFIASLPGHISCSSPIDPNSCPNCKCSSGQHPFVFAVSISSASPYANNNGDPYNDPGFTSPFFHAFAPRGGNSGYEAIPHDLPVGSTPDGGTNPNPYSGSGYRRYCCCSDFAPNSGP